MKKPLTLDDIDVGDVLLNPSNGKTFEVILKLKSFWTDSGSILKGIIYRYDDSEFFLSQDGITLNKIEIFKKVSQKKDVCVCDIMTLMQSGCQCNSFKTSQP